MQRKFWNRKDEYIQVQMSSRTPDETTLLDMTTFNQNTPSKGLNASSILNYKKLDDRIKEKCAHVEEQINCDKPRGNNLGVDNKTTRKILKFTTNTPDSQYKSEKFISLSQPKLEIKLSTPTTIPKRQAISELRLPKNYKIFIFGGIDPHSRIPCEGHGKDVLNYDIYLNHWEAISSMPGSRHHHSAVFCNGKIYVIGGTRPAYKNFKSTLAKSMWSLDPEQLEWTNEKSLPYPRRDFGVVATAKGLYVFGGENCAKTLISSHIFYDVSTRTWIKKSPLMIARSGIAAAVVGKHIWAAGGIVNNQSAGLLTNIIENYDIKEDQWTEFGRLRIPRCFGRLCTIQRSEVYLIGGVSLDGNKKFSSIASIDKYFFEFKEWKEVTRMITARHGHDVVTIDDKIFIFGGVSTHLKATLNSVECLCTEDMTWIEGITHMPGPSSGLAAVAIN